jgi:hypothetical protein
MYKIFFWRKFVSLFQILVFSLHGTINILHFLLPWLSKQTSLS